MVETARGSFFAVALTRKKKRRNNMSKLLNEGFSWLRRSISEHENLRQTTSQQPAAATATRPRHLPHQARSLDFDVSTKPPPLVQVEEGDMAASDSLPILSEESKILDNGEDLLWLEPKLPTRITGYEWKLAFSTERDGFSLNSIYRYFGILLGPYGFA